MTHILNPDNSLKDWLAENQIPVYRSKQIRRWLYQGRAKSFDDMSDLPKPLRDQFTANFTIWTTNVVKHQKSVDGTEKLLLELSDGGRIECVLCGKKTVALFVLAARSVVPWDASSVRVDSMESTAI